MSENSTTTERGFPAPANEYEERMHERGDTFLIIRLTRHEEVCLKAWNHGVAGRFCLQEKTDGTHELLRYADA